MKVSSPTPRCCPVYDIRNSFGDYIQDAPFVPDYPLIFQPVVK